ncbi:hypothetical protein AN220_13035, partial [Streptomyces nanshensis]
MAAGTGRGGGRIETPGAGGATVGARTGDAGADIDATGGAVGAGTGDTGAEELGAAAASPGIGCPCEERVSS